MLKTYIAKEGNNLSRYFYIRKSRNLDTEHGPNTQKNQINFTR